MTLAERVWENEGGHLRRPESTATPSPGPASVRVLLTASRDPNISEAVVLAELLENEPRSH
jgi:hypothetical protein